MKISKRYWDDRYRSGRTSGANSEGQAAIDKAAYINQIITNEKVTSIIDWGVGDGTVLSYITRSVSYIGVDVSEEIIIRNRNKFGVLNKIQFMLDDEAVRQGLCAQMALSCDVLFHLVDDDEYELYIRRLFASAQQLVLICSYNEDLPQTARHIRRRHWSKNVGIWFPGWILDADGQHPAQQDFYLYRRQ